MTATNSTDEMTAIDCFITGTSDTSYPKILGVSVRHSPAWSLNMRPHSRYVTHHHCVAKSTPDLHVL